MNTNQSTIDINAGQDLFPVAVLPGTSSLEASCTVANFTTELFELAEAVDMEEDAALEQYVTEILEPAGGTTLTLGQTPVAGSVSIRGLEADTDFTVTGTTVTLTTATTADTVSVSYRVAVTGGSKMVIDNKSSAVGTAYFKYPVYSSGDDCTKAGVSGYVVVEIFRCRVTGHPTIAGSYKSASTFDLTLSAIKNTSSNNPGKAYAIEWIPA